MALLLRLTKYFYPVVQALVRNTESLRNIGYVFAVNHHLINGLLFKLVVVSGSCAHGLPLIVKLHYLLCKVLSLIHI